MTDTQRNEIKRLRQDGMGYVKIAQILDMSENTVKAYCRRNGLSGNRNGHVITDPFAPHTQSEDIVGRTGRYNLISSENRGNSSGAERPETVDFTGFSQAQPSPKVDLVFAENADRKAVHEVLGMLLRQDN